MRSASSTGNKLRVVLLSFNLGSVARSLFKVTRQQKEYVLVACAENRSNRFHLKILRISASSLVCSSDHSISNRFQSPQPFFILLMIAVVQNNATDIDRAPPFLSARCEWAEGIGNGCQSDCLSDNFDSG